jgi:hypothetical protein
LIDFNKNPTPKKHVEPIKEEELPLEQCSCNHSEHRTFFKIIFITHSCLGSEEKYTLLDHEPTFERIEADSFEMDEWLTYYNAVESKVTSWRQFLVENELI